MKKYLLISLLFLFMTSSVFSQGLYFDIGFGVGNAKTEIDGYDVSDLFDSSVTEIGVDLGLKLGYGPVASMPIYIIGEISGIGHRFEDDVNYIQFNSYLIGPGVIYYPIPLIQIGTSIGYSFVSNQTDLPMSMYDSDSGLAGNVSAAFDLGKGNHGCLIGIKYAKATNTLEVSGAEQESSLFSAFIKYAYRKKI